MLAIVFFALLALARAQEATEPAETDLITLPTGSSANFTEPNQCTGLNEVWYDCRSACPATCDKLLSFCPFKPCEAKCDCANGYFRDSNKNNECVPLEECTRIKECGILHYIPCKSTNCQTNDQGDEECECVPGCSLFNPKPKGDQMEEARSAAVAGLNYHERNHHGHSRDHNGHAHARDHHEYNHHERDHHARDHHARDHHARDHHERDHHERNHHARDHHARDHHARDHHERDYHERNHHERKQHARDHHARDHHERNHNKRNYA